MKSTISPGISRFLKAAGRWLAISGVLLFVVFIVCCIPRRIYREYKGLEVAMTDPVQVMRENEWLIDGWLSCPPFFSKSFYGNIQISTHPVQYDNVNLVLTVMGGIIRGALHYSDEVLYIGDLCTDINFGSIVVRLDGDVDEVRDRLLVAPATAAEDVEGVMKNLNLIWLRDFTGLWSLPRESVI